MGEHSEPARSSPDSEDGIAALRQIIEHLRSGDAAAGALRVYMRDGTVKEISFGDTEEERAVVVAALWIELARQA